MRKAIWPEYLFKPAAALADPSRAAMLAVLMDGTALPAGDLAQVAGIGAPAASKHLARLLDEGFVAMERQGRHRYYRLANADVAAALETMVGLMPRPRERRRHGDPSLWRARLCYHHVAGRLGVALCRSLLERQWMYVDDEGYRLSQPGRAAIEGLGLLAPDAPAALPGRLCLDWTERRRHIGGTLGRELAQGLIERVDWLRPSKHDRVLTPTPVGMAALPRELGIDPSLLVPDQG